MITDQTIDRLISAKLMEENKRRTEAHEPSGKLSASSLGKPLQWQVLKTLGVPPRQIDEYAVRMFLRGNHVEDWIVSHLQDVVETQKLVEYRKVIGYADAIVDTKDYEFKAGVMPLEIKSTKNSSFNWIIKEKVPKRGHCLQGALYAISQNSKYFGVLYVAADDYRIWMPVLETSKYKDEVDTIIDNYDNAIKNRIVPVFDPPEAWMAKPEYNDYPLFSQLTSEEIDKVLYRDYPECYKRLKEGIK